MAGLLAFSQSSLFLLPKYRLQSPPAYYLSPPSAAFSHLSGTKPMLSPTFCLQKRLASCRIRCTAVSDSKMLSTIAADSAGGNYADLSPETGGGDSGGADGDKGGHGRGGDGDGDVGNSNGGDNGKSGESGKSLYTLDEIGMILFQTVTLGYAVLMGARGVNDYLGSRNQKSLMYDVGSTVLLLLVHMFLPSQKKFASYLGFEVSFHKFRETSTRFEKSGKIIPDALLSYIDFLMLSWYILGVFVV